MSGPGTITETTRNGFSCNSELSATASQRQKQKNYSPHTTASAPSVRGLATRMWTMITQQDGFADYSAMGATETSDGSMQSVWTPFSNTSEGAEYNV